MREPRLVSGRSVVSGRGDRAGVAIITAVLLSLAATLLAHALFMLARVEYGAAAAGRELLAAQVAAEEALWGALRPSFPVRVDGVVVGGETGAVSSESVLRGAFPPGTRALQAPGVSARAWMRRVGSEVWNVEAEAIAGVVVDRRALPVWIVDARARSAELEPDPIVRGSAAPLGHLTLDALLERVGVGLESVGTPWPSERLGVCLEDDPWNWGDPRLLAPICSEFFGVHAAPAGLRAEGGVGQGLLVVRGDLTLRDTEFHGLIVTTGDVWLVGDAEVRGAVVSAGDVFLNGAARVRADSSLVRMALSLPEVRTPYLLPDARRIR